MFFLASSVKFPEEIHNHIQKVFFPSGITEKEIARYSRSLPSLWEKLALHRGQNKESHYSLQQAEAQTYAAYYMPANCLKIPLVLEEAYLLDLDLMEKENNTWLDFGTGPGTAFLGLRWWLEKRKKHCRFIGFDQSDVFLKIAESFARIPSPNIDPKFQNSKKSSVFQSIDQLNPTHVSFVNSIAEIYPDLNERIDAIQEILSRLKKQNKRDSIDRHLIIIEPGSKQSSRELAQLKDSLQKDDSEVILPCIDNRICGALKRAEDWCHEETACEFPEWLQEIGSAAMMKKESVLFSYMVMRISQNTPSRDYDCRVVSQRLERKGQTECWICTKDGKISTRAQKSKMNEFSERVTSARRGDLWGGIRISEKGDLLEARKTEAREQTIF